MPRGIQLLAEEPKEHRDDLVVRADVARHEFAVRVLNDAGADRPLEGRDGIRGDLECVCVAEDIRVLADAHIGTVRCSEAILFCNK